MEAAGPATGPVAAAALEDTFGRKFENLNEYNRSV